MKLYFVRHASASDIASSDATRELTKEGREESRVVGVALAKLGAQPNQILSSPLVRARHTAAIVAEHLKFQGEIAAFDELQNACSTAHLLRTLKVFSDAKELLLVGHMPSLASHLAVLLGSDNPAALSMSKASVACLELTDLRPGHAELRWFLRQKQLRLLA